MTISRHPRNVECALTPLAACLALIAGSAFLHANAGPLPAFFVAGAGDAAGSVRAPAVRRAAVRATAASATTYEVTSCADDGSPGTLRYVIDHASDGDTADLSTLACSTITLASGEILISQESLTIIASQANPVTIDAGRHSRVIEHDGSGHLALTHVSLANGYFKYNSVGGTAKGGCILSNGTLYLESTTIAGCTAANTQGRVLGGAVYAYGPVVGVAASEVTGSAASGLTAFGGGIFSHGGVDLDHTSIAGNTVVSTVDDATSIAVGGGVSTDGLLRFSYSTVADNQAQSTVGTAFGGGAVGNAGSIVFESAISGNAATSPGSSAGGLMATGRSYVYSSTIDHNQSVNNAAFAFGGGASTFVNFDNATISTNTATTGSSAVFSSIPMFIHNTTIAFNSASGSSAGLYLYTGATTLLESTIIADNASTSGAGFDLVANAAVSGSHDLIMNPASAVPGDTLTGVDPLLEPLALNGGLVRPGMTHALAPTSPAIDRGTNSRNEPYDERGDPFVRVFGISADMGAYEWQGDDTDTIFANGFE